MNDTRDHPNQTGKLTATQLALLESAVEKGYFDVPRKTTLVELADDHEILDRDASEELRDGLSVVLHAYLQPETASD